MFEIIIVDNSSSDGSSDLIRSEFCDVRLIQNHYNAGFSVATNQAMRHARGRYLVWLNTDTIVSRASFIPLIRFLEMNPRIGIVGPKVLNRDGSFQAQCRRGMPTPLVAVAYFLGLHQRYPRVERFGQYLLCHLPVDEPNRVAAVSGAALLCRREVLETVGPIDEEIFAFGEDIDWCVRAQQKGWEVWYQPEATIVHLGGEGGSKTRPFRRIRALHQAMWVFYRKHLSGQRGVLTNTVVRLGILMSLGLSLLRGAIRLTVARVRP